MTAISSAAIPGSYSPGFEPEPLLSVPVPIATAAIMSRAGCRHVRTWTMGGCRCTTFHDPAHGLILTVARDDRLPSWDEAKTARYRLLPADRTFALLLPPPSDYVDDPRNPFVLEIREIEPSSSRPAA